MTKTVAELQVSFEAEGVAQVGKAIDQVDAKVKEVGKGFSSTLSSMGDSAMKFGGILSAGVTAPLALLGKNIIGMASDVNESLSAVNTVFGSSASEITSWADDSATALGISEGAALSASGQLGALFKGLGLGQADQVDFSKNTIQMASDLASFYNVEPGDALTGLRSGLIGEAEPLRRFGILITEGTMKAKALEMGLGDVNGVLTEGEKVQARYALIMEQMGSAQGDFARTSDGLANSQRILTAELADLGAEFGEILLPFAQRGVKVARDLVGWFGKLEKPTKVLIVAFAAGAAAVGPLLLGLGGVLKVAATLGPALSFLTGPVGLVIAALGGLYLAYQTNFLGFADGVQGALGWLQDAFERVGGIVGNFVDTFTSLTGQGFNPVEAAFRSFNGVLRSVLGDSVEPFSVALHAIIDAGRAVGDWVQGSFLPVLRALGGYFQIVATDGDYLNDFLTHLPDGIRPVVQWLGVLGSTVQKVIEGFGAGGLQGAFSAFRDFLPTLAGEAANYLGSMLALGGQIIGALWQGLQDRAPQVWGWITGTFLPGVGGALGGLAEQIVPHARLAFTRFKWAMQAKWMMTIKPWLESLPGQFVAALGALKDWTLEVGLPNFISFAAGFKDDVAVWLGDRLFDLDLVVDKFADWALEIGLPAAGEGLTIAANFATDLISTVAGLVRQVWESPDAATVAEAEKLGTDLGSWLGGKMVDGIGAGMNLLFSGGGAPAFQLDSGMLIEDMVGMTGPSPANLGDVFRGFDQSFSDALWVELEPVLDKAFAKVEQQIQTRWDAFIKDALTLELGPLDIRLQNLGNETANDVIVPEEGNTGPTLDWMEGFWEQNNPLGSIGRLSGLAPKGAGAAPLAGGAQASDLTAQITTMVTSAVTAASTDQTLINTLTSFSDGIALRISAGVATATAQWTAFETNIRTGVTGAVTAITTDQAILDQIAMIGTTIAQHAGTGIGDHVMNLKFATHAMVDTSILFGIEHATAQSPSIGTALATNAGTGIGGQAAIFQSAITALVNVGVASGQAAATSQAPLIGQSVAMTAGIGIGDEVKTLQSAIIVMVEAGVLAGVDIAADISGYIGEAISSGAALGVMTDALVGPVQTMVGNSVIAAQNALQAASPSRVFIPLGESIPAAFVVGIEHGMSAVMDALTSGLDQIERTATDTIDQMGPFTVPIGQENEKPVGKDPATGQWLFWYDKAHEQSSNAMVDHFIQVMGQGEWLSDFLTAFKKGSPTMTALQDIGKDMSDGMFSGWQVYIDRYGQKLITPIMDAFAEAKGLLAGLGGDLGSSLTGGMDQALGAGGRGHKGETYAERLARVMDKAARRFGTTGTSAGEEFGASFNQAAGDTMGGTGAIYENALGRGATEKQSQALARLHAKELAGMSGHGDPWDLYVGDEVPVAEQISAARERMGLVGKSSGQSFGTSFTQAAGETMSREERQIDEWMGGDWTSAQTDTFRELAKQHDLWMNDNKQIVDDMGNNYTDLIASGQTAGQASGQSFGTSFTQAAGESWQNSYDNMFTAANRRGLPEETADHFATAYANAFKSHGNDPWDLFMDKLGEAERKLLEEGNAAGATFGTSFTQGAQQSTNSFSLPATTFSPEAASSTVASVIGTLTTSLLDADWSRFTEGFGQAITTAMPGVQTAIAEPANALGASLIEHAALGVSPDDLRFSDAVAIMVIDGIAEGRLEATTQAGLIGGDLVTHAGFGIGPMAGEFIAATNAFIDVGVAAGVTHATDIAGQIGAAVTQGAVAGIDPNALNGAVTEMVANSVKTANQELEAASPSKLFRRLFHALPEGAALGIVDRMPEVERALVDGLARLSAVPMPAWGAFGWNGGVPSADGLIPRRAPESGGHASPASREQRQMAEAMLRAEQKIEAAMQKIEAAMSRMADAGGANVDVYLDGERVTASLTSRIATKLARSRENLRQPGRAGV